MDHAATMSRRGAIRLGALAGLAAGPAMPRGGHAAAAAPSPRIRVHHEWGALREAVVGVASGRFPTTLAAAPRRFLTPDAIALIEANPGAWLQEVDPALQERMEAQLAAATAILESRGVVVHRADRLRPDEVAFLGNLDDAVLQPFVRDPILVVGDRVIETAMYEPYRRRERFGIRRAIAGRLEELGATLASMPEPYPWPPDAGGGYGPGPFLEGGDVLLVGRDIHVGNSGNATNAAGIRWLQGFLGPEYRVHEVRLHPRWLHLDCVLSLPRPGLAVICREAFVDGLPAFLAGWDLIDVSEQDAHELLGVNGLVLDENAIVIDERMAPTLGEELARRGIEAIPTPFDVMAMQGGGLRCWHHPLIRESAPA